MGGIDRLFSDLDQLPAVERLAVFELEELGLFAREEVVVVLAEHLVGRDAEQIL